MRSLNYMLRVQQMGGERALMRSSKRSYSFNWRRLWAQIPQRHMHLTAIQCRSGHLQTGCHQAPCRTVRLSLWHFLKFLFGISHSSHTFIKQVIISSEAFSRSPRVILFNFLKFVSRHLVVFFNAFKRAAFTLD